MVTRRLATQTARQRKVKHVLRLFREAIPAGELDKNDWGSLQVAARLVYETEDLRVLLRDKSVIDRDFSISYWIESMESGIEFMSWVKALASIVKWQTYSKERSDVSIEELWQRHRVLASRLLARKLGPEKRLSLLVELGSLELSILGQLWWLEPSSKATSLVQPKIDESAKRRVKKSVRKSSKKL